MINDIIIVLYYEIQKECAPVKMTTTAIMREGARVMKEEEDIEARLVAVKLIDWLSLH